MKNTFSMKYNKDYRYLYRKGMSISAQNLVIYYKKCLPTKNILGITVTKKLGNAVVRNRVKRLIRECYRLRESEMSFGYKIVIVAKNRAAKADFYNIKSDIGYLLKKSGIIASDNERDEKKDNANE